MKKYKIMALFISYSQSKNKNININEILIKAENRNSNYQHNNLAFDNNEEGSDNIQNL